MSEHATEPDTPHAPEKFKRHLRVAWFSTAFTLATYFILMVAVAVAPGFLARTLSSESNLTIGIVAGVAIILVLIGISTVFTAWNNKVDEIAEGPGAEHPGSGIDHP